MRAALAQKHERCRQRREALLAAARELLDGGGEHALTLVNLLTSTGTSFYSFYKVFPTGIEEVRDQLRREGRLLDDSAVIETLCNDLGCDQTEIVVRVRALLGSR